MTIFERRTTKMNITFLWEMGYQILFLSVFFKKTHTGWMKAEKPVLVAHFLLYQYFFGSIVSKNNRIHPWVDSHQACEFPENRFTTGGTSSCVLYISCGFLIRDFRNGKRDSLAPFKFEGIWIAVISFRNVAKRFLSWYFHQIRLKCKENVRDIVYEKI